MKFRQFGQTEFLVSELSLGSMRLTGDAAHVPAQLKTSGSAAGAVNEEGRKVVHAALEAGINSFHSSEDYGTWWLLGDALKHRKERQEIHHMVKVTTPDYSESSFNPNVVRSSVEKALSALHAERITFVQHLQRGPRVSPAEAYSTRGDARRIEYLKDKQASIMDTFETLRLEGKIGTTLTFPHTMGFMKEAVSRGNYQGVVHFLNLLETEILPHFDSMRRHKMGFFALRPLLQGMLSDRRSKRAELPSSDPATLPVWDSRYEVLEKVREAMGPQGDSLSVLAYRFALSFPEATSIVSSIRTVSQLEEYLYASEAGALSRETLRKIRIASASADGFSKFDLFPENQRI